MIWINILNWQHPTHYHRRRATPQGCAASPLQGSASVKPPPMKAGTARAFAALAQLPKPTGAL